MSRWKRLAGLAVPGHLRSHLVLLSIFLVAALAPHSLDAQSPALPPPAYDTTLYAFVYAESLATGAELDTAAKEVLDRVQPGPYARVGFADYFALDIPWNGNPAATPLTQPSRQSLEALLERAQQHGLAFHVAAMGGVSRAVSVYAAAKREDRRNAQWFAGGSIVPPGSSAAASLEAQVQTAYATPSRYARRLRRHLEAKVRAFAKLFLELRGEFPDTLVSASGDAEAELNPDALDPSLPYEQQLIADYSPFAILEFRDWLLHQGLYADGAEYAGEGYAKQGEAFDQGPGALSPANLAKFNADFETWFASWRLRYFDWSLADPVDGDPRAIAAARSGAPDWSPFPGGAADYVDGGFDAPRFWNDGSPRFWQLWLLFRSTMLAHYARDFATWMTTTPGPGGETIEPERWYSHQIPGDYLNGTNPDSEYPNYRLLLSGSPLWTSLIPPELGSPGVTVLDPLGPGGYERTSEYVFDDLEKLGVANWGMPEYSPSWHIDVAPEASVATIVAQYHRAVDAGAHMFAFTPWPHLVLTQNGPALGQFLAGVKYEPRDAGRVAYAPAQVRGLVASSAGATASFSWLEDIFAEAPGFGWHDWPRFRQFELWRGSHLGFTTGDGRAVRVTTEASATGVALSPAQPYYKVAALSRDGKRGPLSDPVLVGEARPGPSPTPSPGTGPHPGSRPTYVRLCRLLETRLPPGPDGGPALAPGSTRVVEVTGRCGVPAGATTALVTLLVSSPPEAGRLEMDPGDPASAQTIAVDFARGRTTSRQLTVRLAAGGTIALTSRAASQLIDVMLFVSGYSP